MGSMPSISRPQSHLDPAQAVPYPPTAMAYTIGSLFLCMTALWGTAALCAEPPKTVPEESVLLLYNGNVLSGKVSRQGEHYLVTFSTAEITIRASQVELVCRNLEDGYQQKRAVLRGGSTQDHLDLALWCLRQGLLDHAAGELSEARRLEPNHPRITVLAQHLAMTQRSRHDPKRSIRKPLPLRHVPSGDELDRMVRSLPRGAMETFTTTVQPILLNHCSTTGCHNPQGDSHLHLERLPTLRHASRRPTHRNLHAVLKLIERGAPDRSPLLTYPIRSHGGAEDPVFTRHNSDQYEHLVEWVRRLSGPDTVATAASVGPPPSPKTLSPKTLSPKTPSLKTPSPKSLRQPSSVIPARFDQVDPVASTSAAGLQTAPLPPATSIFSDRRVGNTR